MFLEQGRWHLPYYGSTAEHNYGGFDDVAESVFRIVKCSWLIDLLHKSKAKRCSYKYFCLNIIRFH